MQELLNIVILARLGIASKELIAAYRSAYEKRLNLNKVTEQMLADDFNVPEIQVRPSLLPLSTNERTLHIHVKATDSLVQLKQLNIYINDVPLNGLNGIDLRSKRTALWEQDIAVDLSSGINKVQVSAVNVSGTESLKYTSNVVYTGPSKLKADLYLVAVGVSKYQDASYKLDYAAKDAQDFVKFWQGKRDRFGAIHVLPLINPDAKRDKIIGAKTFLANADVDDEVIVFFAGHGVLDDKETYYFATQDMDFTHPASRGLPYEEIEGLVDGIRARRKLVLIDTCQAGEVDTGQENNEAITGGNTPPELSVKDC